MAAQMQMKQQMLSEQQALRRAGRMVQQLLPVQTGASAAAGSGIGSNNTSGSAAAGSAGSVSYSDPSSTRALWLHPAGGDLNTHALSHELDYANHAQRARMKAFFDQPLFVPQYNLSVAEERALALKRLQAICAQGFFSVRDFRSNPDAIFAAHELTGYVDGAAATKMTVQFNVRTHIDIQGPIAGSLIWERAL
jgi:hypothetical protein